MNTWGEHINKRCVDKGEENDTCIQMLRPCDRENKSFKQRNQYVPILNRQNMKIAHIIFWMVIRSFYSQPETKSIRFTYTHTLHTMCTVFCCWIGQCNLKAARSLCICLFFFSFFISFQLEFGFLFRAVDEISHKMCPLDVMSKDFEFKMNQWEILKKISKLLFYACRKNDKWTRASGLVAYYRLRSFSLWPIYTFDFAFKHTTLHRVLYLHP